MDMGVKKKKRKDCSNDCEISRSVNEKEKEEAIKGPVNV